MIFRDPQPMQGYEAVQIQQRPRRFDAVKPVPDGWVLQHTGRYHGAVLTGLGPEPGPR